MTSLFNHMFSVMLVRSGLTGVAKTCNFILLKTLTLLASRFTLFGVCFIRLVFVPGFSFLFLVGRSGNAGTSHRNCLGSV